MINQSRDRSELISVSCVVPCWNDAEGLDLLLPILTQTLGEITPDWEILLVDDGSAIEAAKKIQGWARISGIKVIQFSRNFGKEAALTAGLQASVGDVVVMMDADMQHPPELIRTLFIHWQRGADMVYAIRTSRQDEGWIKRWGTPIFYKLMNHSGRFSIPAGAGDFRLMDRQVVDALLALPERNRFMKGLDAWVGFDSVAIPYEPAERAVGQTSFNLWRLLSMSVDALTAFTNWPLRLVSIVGIVLALLGFSYGGYLTLVYFLDGNDVSGWSTIVVSLMLFMGMQMIALGVLGEYISRIFEEVKARPLYVVKQSLGEGLKERKE